MPELTESTLIGGRSFSSPYIVTSRVLSTAPGTLPTAANLIFVGSSVNCTRAIAASEAGSAKETSIGFCGAYAVALAACSNCNPSSHSVPFPSNRSTCDGASRTGLKGSSKRCHWSPG